jgi:hypothetical protein
MTYVSFVEIFPKAIGGFEEGLGLVDGHDLSDEMVAAAQGQAYCYTTLSFFGVILLMKVRGNLSKSRVTFSHFVCFGSC